MGNDEVQEQEVINEETQAEAENSNKEKKAVSYHTFLLPFIYDGEGKAGKKHGDKGAGLICLSKIGVPVTRKRMPKKR